MMSQNIKYRVGFGCHLNFFEHRYKNINSTCQQLLAVIFLIANCIDTIVYRGILPKVFSLIMKVL